MAKLTAAALSRRERQIMDIVYQRGEASASDVLAALPDAPSYSAVRALLRILEDKGHLTHAEQGKKYVFRPTQAQPVAARSALERLVRTFFNGNATQAVATLISDSESEMSDDDLDRLAAMIQAAKQDRGAR